MTSELEHAIAAFVVINLAITLWVFPWRIR